MRWLEVQPGAQGVLCEDPVVLMVDGRWNEDLKSELGACVGEG